ncbi:dynein regulatory complex subunit 7 [Prorops nasuta]|uniref:dynein regulatory complex subunit 7 n=1 Tax=Prorops nasuta TaxID=863751 RepID=UPI0034CD8EE5
MMEAFKDDGEEYGEIGGKKIAESWRITEGTLKDIERDLCLIRLCWPEKNDFANDSYLSMLPKTYFNVSDKERLLLWEAENFRMQYHMIYKDRKPLLLACENECGAQRFVSTTIRRSTLPYPELYTWQGCAKFVSDYVRYEPPEEALVMPRFLRSPTWVLHFQRGNNVELATLLTSLLLGEGYNAYIVNGYASREQVECNFTRTPCPFTEKSEQSVQSVETQQDVVKYLPEPPPDFRSQFLLSLEQMEREREEAEQRQKDKQREEAILREERLPLDPLFGRRIHFWVLILPGERSPRSEEIKGPIFIEPSSGLSYDPSSEEAKLLYLGVESIWNDRNYWVNMQQCANACASTIWDLTNIHLWEHLLPGEPWETRDDLYTEPDITIRAEKNFDMEFSYVQRLRISELDYQKRYPNGNKTIFYKRTKVELYAPYVQEDGLVQRITIYEDLDYLIPLEIREKYSNRSDNLMEVERDLGTKLAKERYARGRPDKLKEHQYYENDGDTLQAKRHLQYYNVRSDGLLTIQTGPLRIIQHFVGRPDRLYYREVQYSFENRKSSPGKLGSRQIWMISQKYDRNKAVPASKDIAIQEFAIGENEIRLKFHYEEGAISRAVHTFVRPLMANRGDRLVYNASMTTIYDPDPMAAPKTESELYEQLKTHLNEEERSMSFIRLTEAEISTILKTRAFDQASPMLRFSVFDKYRSSIETLQLRRERERSSLISNEIDVLRPYLARIGNPGYIGRAEALDLQEECLRDIQKLFVDRANNILRKFEECKRELEDTQTQLIENQNLSREEREKLGERINELHLKLQTLEVRLNRHQETMPLRYRALEELLPRSPAMSVLDK